MVIFFYQLESVVITVIVINGDLHGYLAGGLEHV